MQNKKYTVYQIEKLSKGKLTKYKLTKAILSGELKAEQTKETKHGRGLPNYFIYEDELNTYLENVEKNKSHNINIPEEEIQEINKTNQNNESLEELLKKNIENFYNLEQKILKIQKDYEEIIPLLKKESTFSNFEETKSSQRKEIIEELETMPSFMVKKRKDLLSKLNKLV